MRAWWRRWVRTPPPAPPAPPPVVHAPDCPARPAFVPVWAIGLSDMSASGEHVTAYLYRQWTMIHHPPEPCALEGCGLLISSSTRHNRPKRKPGKPPRVYCTAGHKYDASHPARLERVPKGPAYTPPTPRPCPRPDKWAFDTEAACRQRMHTVLVSDGTLEVYQCICRRWHAGHPNFDRGQTIGAIARGVPLTGLGVELRLEDES